MGALAIVKEGSKALKAKGKDLIGRQPEKNMGKADVVDTKPKLPAPDAKGGEVATKGNDLIGRQPEKFMGQADVVDKTPKLRDEAMRADPSRKPAPLDNGGDLLDAISKYGKGTVAATLLLHSGDTNKGEEEQLAAHRNGTTGRDAGKTQDSTPADKEVVATKVDKTDRIQAKPKSDAPESSPKKESGGKSATRSEFEKAFAAARKDPEAMKRGWFEWKGKKYITATRDEDKKAGISRPWYKDGKA